MEWMILPLRRYADFSGRSTRKEYWMFILLWAICFGTWSTVNYAITGSMELVVNMETAGGVWGLIGLILMLPVVIPSIAVSVRRFHDQDKSGWYYLLNFIPYLGTPIVILLMCLDGTPGPNRYGPDPKM